jgi:hypothetical protein
VAAVDQQLACAWRLKAGEDLEQGRLAATAGADHGDELARLRYQVDAVEGEQRLLSGEFEGLGERADLEPCGGASLRRRAHHRASVCDGGRQRMTARSSALTTPNNTSVSSAVTITAPNTRSALKYSLAAFM